MKNKQKNYFSLLFFVITASLILIPISIFGLTDNEEYKFGIFSSIYFYRGFSINNIFSTFVDFFGPGINLPIGQGLFFFPTNIFSFNLKLFYLTTIFFNLLLQFIYFKRLTKICFNYKSNFLSLVFIFSISNFQYLYFTDWISCFVTFSLYTPIIYYSIKYLRNKDYLSFTKKILFLSILILNGHLGFAVFLIYFLIILYLLNCSFFCFKKKHFYLLFLSFILIVSERIYHVVVLYAQSSGIEGGIHDGYNYDSYIYGSIKFFFTIIRIFEIILGLNNNFGIKPINGREVIYGLSFLISLFYSIYLLIYKNSKNVFYLNIVFLIFFAFTFFKQKWIPFAGSGTWQSRDLLYILTFLFIAKLLSEINNRKIFNFFFLLISLSSFVLWIESVNFIKNNHLIPLENYEKIEKNSFLKKLSSDKNYKKIYLSPQVFNTIYFSEEKNYFTDNHIYSLGDFHKYEINVFNVVLKNQSLDSLRKPEIKMYTKIEPRFNEINNPIFLQLFRIKNILIYKNELKKINLGKFKIIDKVSYKKNELLILELKDFSNIIIDKNDTKLDYDKCFKYESINCLIDKNIFETEKNIIFNKLGDNNFKITNKNTYKINYVLPFVEINNFINSKDSIIINKDLIAIKIKAGETKDIILENNTPKYLRMISMIIFFLTMSLVFIKKGKL
jgi:hypothetical protein|tara:strand:- start:1693 stop:3705 length:2013 start_codon:yes stop_codon:yes gene_type:complete